MQNLEKRPIRERRLVLIVALMMGVLIGAAADAVMAIRHNHVDAAVATASRPILRGADGRDAVARQQSDMTAADAMSPDARILGDAPVGAANSLPFDSKTGETAPSGATSGAISAIGNAQAGNCSCAPGSGDDDEAVPSPLMDPKVAHRAKPAAKPFRVTRCRAPEREGG